MSTKIVEKAQFEAVVTRMMHALSLKNEYNVAELLGFKKDTFSARKKRGALPLDKIRLLCSERGINFNWLMSGDGEVFVSDREKAPKEPSVQTDEVLEFVLGTLTPELRLAINDLKDKSPDEILDYIRGGRKALREGKRN